MNLESIERRAGDALTYLAETDESAAQLKYEALVAQAKYEASRDAHFMAAEGNNEERKAASRIATQELYMTFLEKQLAHDKVKNKRDHECVVVEWLRSLNANRRQGT